MSRADSFNLYDYFLGQSRLSSIGEQTAITYRGEPLSYIEVRRLVDDWAARLIDSGVRQGDRVALLLYDSPIFIAAFLAGAGIGALSVPVNTALAAEEIEFIISDSGARLIICEAALQDKLAWLKRGDSEALSEAPAVCVVDARRWSRDELPQSHKSLELPHTNSDSPAFMLYTSGSTGTPKGAVHRQGAPRDTALTYGAKVLQLTKADKVYSSSRLFFAYGLGNSLTFPLAAGATVILDCERPTPERIARIFTEQQPTVFFGVPAVYRALLEFNANQGLATASLRLCVSAGEALPAHLFEAWRDRFDLEILDGIGSTEMLHIFIANHPHQARGGSSGCVVDGYAARLLDDAGRDVESDSGNLWVSGASAFVGYWNRPELTAATIVDGWVKTGDLYRRDDAGFYYHVGRSDDCFKVSGLWVSPIEVESLLMTHPEVVEAAVVSAKGADGLATARAFVVIRTKGDAEKIIAELKEFARLRLPRYKAPSEIHILADLPRTATGKVQRFRLRELGVSTTKEEQA